MIWGDVQSSLVPKAVGGDRAALKLLLASIHADVRARIARRLPADLTRVVDADDILQETYIEVFQRVGRFENRVPDAFPRWVASIAISRLRNAIAFHRAAKRGGDWRLWERLSPGIEESSVALIETLLADGRKASRSLARHEAVQALRAAMNAIPEQYQRAIWLVHLEGRPVRDAAAVLGRTERAVHGLCARGLKLLREQLDRSVIGLSSAD
jgi:RNA polymerase sigma-70 factor (ECF subfamily)